MKPAARTIVRSSLDFAERGTKPLLVRINSLDSGLACKDLAASLGARANHDSAGEYTFPYQWARAQCLYAACALGVVAIDAVSTNIRDDLGLLLETTHGVRDGFLAKAAIHPAQAAIINQAMTPSDDELAWAQAVVSALGESGVAIVDGKMVDMVHKKMADQIIARVAAISR